MVILPVLFIIMQRVGILYKYETQRGPACRFGERQCAVRVTSILFYIKYIHYDLKYMYYNILFLHDYCLLREWNTQSLHRVHVFCYL